MIPFRELSFSSDSSSTLQQALTDARQTAAPHLRWNALEFLWICAPDVAERERLPLADQRQADSV